MRLRRSKISRSPTTNLLSRIYLLLVLKYKKTQIKYCFYFIEVELFYKGRMCMRTVTKMRDDDHICIKGIYLYIYHTVSSYVQTLYTYYLVVCMYGEY